MSRRDAVGLLLGRGLKSLVPIGWVLALGVPLGAWLWEQLGAVQINNGSYYLISLHKITLDLMAGIH